MEKVCCESGCNNCVLDEKIELTSDQTNDKENIFNGIYNNFILQSVDKVTKNTLKFSFKYLNRENLENLTIYVPPGHHLIIRAPSEHQKDNRLPIKKKHDKNTKGNYISRQYTPISVNKKELTFSILVKLEENGLMSQYLQNISIGDLTEWKGCYGDFQWKSNCYKNLLCICHGVAIAPIYTIISSILQDDTDDTLIHLLACFENIESILLRDELQQFLGYWNCKIMIYLAHEQCICDNEKINVKRSNCDCINTRLRYNENVLASRLDGKELMKAFIGKDNNSLLTLVCGSSNFIDRIRSDLEKLNLSGKNIIYI